MNRYERMLRGKLKTKRHIANKWYYSGGNACSWDRIQQRYPDAKYWKDWHFSGVRRYASDCTEGVIRCRYRSVAIMKLDDDDIGFGSKRSHYRKHFDYWWTVF